MSAEKKTFTISAALDSTSFDAQIKKMQADLAKLNAPQAQIQAQQATATRLNNPAYGAQMSGPSQEAYKKATQSAKVQLDQRIRDEIQGQEKLSKVLNSRQAMLEKLQKTQSDVVKGSQAELDIKTKIARVEENNFRLRESYKQRDAGLNSLLDAKDKQSGFGSPLNFNESKLPAIKSPSSPGSKFGRGGVTSVAGAAEMLGIPAMAIGAAVTVLAAGMAGEGIRKFYAQADNRSRVAESGAFNAEGQGGQRLSAIAGGGGAEDLMFNPERLKAFGIARNTQNSNVNSMARYISHPQEMINYLGLGTEDTNRESQNKRNKEEADIQQEQFEALKNGPEGAMKRTIGGSYLQNRQRDLDFQRQTGLNTGSFRGQGGFINDVTDAGFTDVQGMGMSSAIMGAGGSTRSATGNASLGLKAQRSFDLTNSGNVLGNLSKGLGDAGVTKEGFVKLLTEGTRLGLDSSQFVDENRKFVEMASDVVGKSGASSGGGIDQVLSQFGKFFGGDKTGAGMEAGKSAYETYRQTSMEMQGPRGTMRAAGILNDPMLKKLGSDSKQALFSMPTDQLRTDNPSIIAMAQEAGTTPEELIKTANRVTNKSANIFKSSDKATQNLSQFYKSGGANYALASTPGDYDVALGRSNIAQSKEHPELAQSQRTLSQLSTGLASGDINRDKSLEDVTNQKLGGEGRPEDTANRINAESAKLVNALFMQIKDSIVPTTDAARQFAEECAKIRAAMQGATPAQQGALFNTFMNNFGSKTVPSSGAPASGGGSGH